MLLVNCGGNNQDSAPSTSESGHSAYDEVEDSLRYAGENHLRNVRQLTFGGDNAEAYWSFASDALIFQATNAAWEIPCDQIFIMELGNDARPLPDRPTPVSTGLGRTTCAYFLPGDTGIVYASTHLGDEACPEVPPRGPNGEYVWPIYADYDIFVAHRDGSNLIQITFEDGYDAEATVSPNGDRMVFTSTRSGDLELYTCNLDGSDVQQVTSELGYDGGAFFSPDGEWLVWRASRPTTEEEKSHYTGLLQQGLVEPTDMELFIGRIDGSETRQLTNLGGANWAPFFHPNGERIIFSSNHHTGGFPFNLFSIRLDGTGLEQITFDKAFDSFPMFSPDGRFLSFSSNRNNGRTRNTNMFVAEWVD